jgi:radical SAM superfamily enzyme YgiQ (UPF0313 family)
VRICLISTPNSAEFTDPLEFTSDKVRRDSCWPQLGILSLAAVTESLGLLVTIYDSNRAFFSFADAMGAARLEEFAEFAASQIAAINAEVYGFGSICSAYPLTLRIARMVKAARPESVVLIGGPQASVVAEATLKAFPFVDFILRGEAEHSLPIFLEELSTQRKFERVPGLVYRTVFGVQRNPDAAPIADLDVLPLPAYHLTGELRGEKTAAIELGRGCPFSCTFCSTNDFFRRKFRLRSPQRILEDMCMIEAEYGIRDFDLTHDMFTVDAKRVREFCQHMIDSGKGYTWACSARTDCVDQEMIEMMAAAGCEGIFFGVETGSQRMQAIIDKDLDVKRAHEIIDICGRAGMRSTVSLIMGFPEEGWEDLLGTVRVFMHSARLPQSQPQLNLLAPLANTPLQVKYRDAMTLEELCSDMSHSARRQNPEDIELIRKYPDIFPNFYLLPTTHLDRAFLLELREFLFMAEDRFRWLLGAVDQATSGILDVVAAWMDYRKSVFSTAIGHDLRRYYQTTAFRCDFFDFLRSHDAGRDPKVSALLDFYERLDMSRPPEECLLSDTVELESCETMDPADIAVRNYYSRLVKLDADLEAVIEAVKTRQTYEPDAKKHFYLVSQEEVQKHPGYEVSHYLAGVLELCDGQMTIAQIMEGLPSKISVIPRSAATQVYEALLERARSEGLIAIYRMASEADASHPGRESIPEYSEIRAAASRQNQSSIQLI